MFDNGYEWQEYSVGLFLNRTNFLNQGISCWNQAAYYKEHIDC